MFKSLLHVFYKDTTKCWLEFFLKLHFPPPFGSTEANHHNNRFK